jgi:hypothetical protein
MHYEPVVGLPAELLTRRSVFCQPLIAGRNAEHETLGLGVSHRICEAYGLRSAVYPVRKCHGSILPRSRLSFGRKGYSLERLRKGEANHTGIEEIPPS